MCNEPLPTNVVAIHQHIKCVWSGRLGGEHDGCEARIPMTVVAQAWEQEVQRRAEAEGFFRFMWRGGTWLSYGCRDGSVRGVYCPSHCAEREDRLGQSASTA